jgi:hypothetical protein
VFAARKWRSPKIVLISKNGIFPFLEIHDVLWRFRDLQISGDANTAYFGDNDDWRRFLEIRTIFGDARAIFGDKNEFWRHAFYR